MGWTAQEMLQGSDTPSVRVGMIRGAEEIRFEVLGPHRIRSSDGFHLEAERASRYAVSRSETSVPGSQHWVRFAITLPGERPTRPVPPGAEVRELVVGRRIQLPHLRVDNRETWHLVGPFPDNASAEAFRRGQPRPGELTVLQLPSGQAEGWATLDGRRVQLPITVLPENPQEPQILLRDVLIGIEFHWQHREDELLRGALEIAAGPDGKLVAINELSAEAYLASVNSSEMTPDSPEELLKAQTVAGRSTLFATAGKHHFGEPFDLCADDHCQCYYGASRERGRSWEAVRSTWGEVLVSDGRVCDARYSKICGGIMEDYRFVWDDRRIPYLTSGVDGPEPLPVPANSEEAARQFIRSSPDVYCNVDRYPLPESLRERCHGLFRWQVRYSRSELEELLATRVGVRVGRLLDLVPMERGDSGRIVHLQVVGTEGRVILGKELEIRRALSSSHLYSSCFYVEKELDGHGFPEFFRLIGAGWGHGVGLCQVGATVMASRGFSYRQILAHYYRRAEILRAY